MKSLFPQKNAQFFIKFQRKNNETPQKLKIYDYGVPVQGFDVS